MCGIVGIFGPFGISSADADALDLLLLVNSKRGNDSTGVFAATRGGVLDYAKHLSGPSYLMDEPCYEKIKGQLYSYEAVIGHGRLATVGEISIENAHPFTVGPITLVHNGKITNFTELKKKHKFKTEVDSEFVTFLFSKYHIEEVLDMIEGAYVFVWHDGRTNKLHIAKNTERPLALMKLPTSGKYVISSEPHVFDLLKRKMTAYSGGEEYAVLSTGYYSYELSDASTTKKLLHAPEERTSQKKPRTGMVYHSTVTKQNTSTSVISHPFQNSHNYSWDLKKGDQIEFWPSEISRMDTNFKAFHQPIVGGEKVRVHLYLIKGTLTEDPWADVFVRLKIMPDVPELSMKLIEKHITKAFIDSIREDKENNLIISGVTPLVVNLDTYNQWIKEQEAEDQKEKNIVKFYTGEEFPHEEAYKLFAGGTCSFCPKPLGIHQIDFTGLLDINGVKHITCLNCLHSEGENFNVLH